MIRKRLVAWAFAAAIEYLEENGEQVAIEVYGKIMVWLRDLIDNFDEDATEKVFASPPPVEGCEDWCSVKFTEFEEIASAA